MAGSVTRFCNSRHGQQLVLIERQNTKKHRNFFERNEVKVEKLLSQLSDRRDIANFYISSCKLSVTSFFTGMPQMLETNTAKTCQTVRGYRCRCYILNMSTVANINITLITLRWRLVASRTWMVFTEQTQLRIYSKVRH